jgi:hypothetical protein
MNGSLNCTLLGRFMLACKTLFEYAAYPSKPVTNALAPWMYPADSQPPPGSKIKVYGVVSKLFSSVSQITDFCDRGQP